MQLHYHDTLTGDDVKRHIAFPFDVPEGATRLTVEFDYTPKRIDGVAGENNIGVSLFDPQNARGCSHARANNNLTLSAVDATPGFTPGALQPGRWAVVIDTHMVLPEAPVEIDLTIQVTSEPISGAARAFFPGLTASRGPGWYRGDLHGHTIHSDGSWDILDFVQYARDYQLDFVTLTDHNTVSGLPECDSYATNDLLTMGGIELTTYYGHCLALGTRRWLEWRVSDERSMRDLAQAVMDTGAYYVIAHPMSEGDPVCTGCDWQYPDMMPGSAPAVEVWNSPWDSISNNEQAVQLWYQWLNQGHRLVATAGTDIHGPAQPGDKLGFNVVYAQALSEYAILDAIREGHLYVSGGPTLELAAQTASGAQAMMGDSLAAEAATLSTRWSGCTAGERLRWIADGIVLDEQAIEPAGEASRNFSAGQVHWVTAEIRNSEGELRALTNPIFLDGRQ